MPAQQLAARRTAKRTAAQRRAGELQLARYHRTRDPGERAALVVLYMPLARSLAVRFYHTGESSEDLLQVASIGLMNAIDRYEPSRGSAFSSYAVPTILGELRRHLRDHASLMRVPRDLQELVPRLTAAVDELSKVLSRWPTVAELGDHLGISEGKVLDARAAIASRTPASLDAPLFDEDEACVLADTVGDEDPRLAEAEDAALLDHYLAVLNSRQRMVLRLRFREDLTQREIGSIVGISQVRVSRLTRQALERLQCIAAAEAVSFASDARDGGSTDARNAAYLEE